MLFRGRVIVGRLSFQHQRFEPSSKLYRVVLFREQVTAGRLSFQHQRFGPSNKPCREVLFRGRVIAGRLSFQRQRFEPLSMPCHAGLFLVQVTTGCSFCVRPSVFHDFVSTERLETHDLSVRAVVLNHLLTHSLLPEVCQPGRRARSRCFSAWFAGQ